LSIRKNEKKKKKKRMTIGDNKTKVDNEQPQGAVSCGIEKI
jgi:hypothetical protein